MQFSILSNQDISGLEKLLKCDDDFKPCYAEELKAFNQSQISQFCLKYGLYQIATHELIEYLRALIAGQDTIEIGAGAGQIGKYLNIPMTDNKHQEWPYTIARYKIMGQPLITYHKEIIEIDGNEAVWKFKPSVVIGAWITAPLDYKNQPMNIYGVTEEPVVDAVKYYIHIGNSKTHFNKRILHYYDHYNISAPWLYTRSLLHDLNRIWIISKNIDAVELPTLFSESTDVKIIRY
jgi:hypothetical protein